VALISVSISMMVSTHTAPLGLKQHKVSSETSLCRPSRPVDNEQHGIWLELGTSTLDSTHLPNSVGILITPVISKKPDDYVIFATTTESCRSTSFFDTRCTLKDHFCYRHSIIFEGIPALYRYRDDLLCPARLPDY